MWRGRKSLTAPDLFADKPEDFGSLFSRILSITLDTTLSPTIRTYLLSFMISAFQSLDCGIIRKPCASLVTIAIWHNLSTETKRDQELNRSVQLKKSWRASAKRYDAADEETKPRLRFERAWLYTLTLDFFSQLYSESCKPGMSPRSFLYAYLLTVLQKTLGTVKDLLSFYLTCRASGRPGDM